MKSYLLRGVPDGLWTQVKARAVAEGRVIRLVILRLLERYVARGLD